MKYLYIDNARCDLSGRIHVDRPVATLDAIDYQITLTSTFEAEDAKVSFRLNALELIRGVIEAFRESDIREWQKISLLISGLSFDLALDLNGYAKIRGLMHDGSEIRLTLSSMFACLDKVIAYSKTGVVEHSGEVSASVISLLDELQQSIGELHGAI